MNCPKCKTPLLSNGVQHYCPKCNPLYTRAGFSIDLHHLL